jgi:predicted DCC family thiol-disulfide oxidoreductase YuxK
VTPWQFADLSALGLTSDECDRAVQWVSMDPSGRRAAAEGPAAIAALFMRGGTFWRLLGRILRTRPMLAAARPVYDFVARHRDRMPGGTATCALPSVQRDSSGDGQ